MSAEVEEEEAWSPPSSCLPSTTLAGIRPAGLALTSSPQDLFQSPLYPAHLPSRPELELIAGLLGYLGEVKEDMEEEVARTPAQQEEKKKGKRKRGRVELRRIEDRTSRQVRFSKRRSGLFKKAYELSVLCDAQVALVVFSPAGRLYEFASSDSSVEEIFGRYWDLANTINDLNIEARDNSRIEWNIQKEQLATSSVSDQLYSIARCAMEANVKEMNMAEIRGFEETVTDALTVIRNKLMMKVARLPQT